MSRAPRSSPVRRAVIILLLYAAIVAAIAAVRWSRAQRGLIPTTVDLVVLQDQVVVRRADAGEVRLAAGDRSVLQRGDEIQTQAQARARLTFAEGDAQDVVTEVGGDARLTILELYETSSARALVAVVALHQGPTFTRIRHLLFQGARFEIETPLATVRARGTAFQCDVLGKDRAYVAVHDGVVNVAMGEQSLDLQAGQGLDLRLGQPFSPIAVSTRPLVDDASELQPSVAVSPTLTDPQKTLFPPVETPTLPGDEYERYTVQPGDTLYSIGRKFGIPWERVWETNKALLPQPESLRAGQELRIPPP